jgi:hypothetical protein
VLAACQTVVGENGLERKTRRVVNGKRMPYRMRERNLHCPIVSLRGCQKQTRKQAAPFRNLHGLNRSRSRRHKGRARTMRAGARTRFAWQPAAGLRRRWDALWEIDWGSFDVRGIIATSAGRCGRKQGEAQKCQRHAEGWTNQTSAKGTHQAAHNLRVRKRIIKFPFFTICDQ